MYKWTRNHTYLSLKKITEARNLKLSSKCMRGYDVLHSMLRNLMSLLIKIFPYITLLFFATLHPTSLANLMVRWELGIVTRSYCGSSKENNQEIIDNPFPMDFRNNQFPGLYWMPSIRVYKSASKSIWLRSSWRLIDPRNPWLIDPGTKSIQCMALTPFVWDYLWSSLNGLEWI